MKAQVQVISRSEVMSEALAMTLLSSPIVFAGISLVWWSIHQPSLF